MSVFSPPESWVSETGRLPFGRAVIETGASSGSSPSSVTSAVASPPKRSAKIFWKASRTWVNVSSKRARAVSLISRMVSRSDASASARSVRWPWRKARRSCSSS